MGDAADERSNLEKLDDLQAARPFPYNLVVGVLVGLGTGALVAALNGWAFLVSPAAIGIALGFSLAVGLFFGVWPARRAAGLNPIEALRYE